MIIVAIVKLGLGDDCPYKDHRFMVLLIASKGAYFNVTDSQSDIIISVVQNCCDNIIVVIVKLIK